MMTQEDEWLARRVSLRNKHRLHMRPAQRVVEMASGYLDTEIRAVKDDFEANAKSIAEMIGFAAYMMNKVVDDDMEFDFEAFGPRAKEALDELEKLVDDEFGLDQRSEG